MWRKSLLAHREQQAELRSISIGICLACCTNLPCVTTQCRRLKGHKHNNLFLRYFSWANTFKRLNREIYQFVKTVIVDTNQWGRSGQQYNSFGLANILSVLYHNYHDHTSLTEFQPEISDLPYASIFQTTASTGPNIYISYTVVHVLLFLACVT